MSLSIGGYRSGSGTGSGRGFEAPGEGGRRNGIVPDITIDEALK